VTSQPLRPGKPTVLLLNTTFKKEGPAETLLGIARELRDRFRIVAACLASGGPTEQAMNALGIPTHNMRMPFPLDPRGVARLSTLIEKERIALLHCQLLRGEVIGTLAAMRSGPVKTVVVVHNTDPYRDPGRFPLRAALSRWALRRADRVVAVSQSVADFAVSVQRVSPDRLDVIPNGNDVPLSVTGPVGRLVVGTAGRLDRQKGIDVLLDAMVRVVSEVVGARLLVAGTGPLRRRLERQAERLGLGDTVRFLGFLDDMESFWSSLDVFVLPSRWEGLPRVVQEAMGRALPVVATDVPGTVELVEDGKDGLIVPCEDSTALAQALVDLLREPQRGIALGRQGRHKMETQYTVKLMAERYAKLYMDLLTEPTP
jgi:glycosyltransferase involved in cell wall biosynthesis